ncbi:U6 snRNA phosphodiesterase 1 [Malaya genurostris]|uniref:U6 snRNA phosphodiesterase 1 n=1 Tax=Malaya genurostris TaxID=325434 RepID=UPI0026F407A7|nr:U6 snRNA phosphodiesterase 1 [Malaya genurostris]
MQNLLQYSSSGSDDDENVSSCAKLPSSENLLRSKLDTMPAAEQDSNEHQGRIRSFPHERGIWASYVFIDYSSVDPIREFQQLIIDKCLQKIQLELLPVDKLHLSLTKTFILRHHNISAFIENVRSVLKGCKRFTILLSELAIYVNEEHTRTFLALKIHDNSTGYLNQLVEKLDGCMRLYKLPEFYKDRSFHVSILWTLGDQRQLLEEVLDEFQQTFALFYEDEYCDMNANVRQIHFKCGNKYNSFELLYI